MGPSAHDHPEGCRDALQRRVDAGAADVGDAGLLEEQRRPRREDELIGDGAEAGEPEEPERPIDEETSQAPAERLLRGRWRRTRYEPHDEQRRRNGAEPEEHHHRSPRQDLDQEAPNYEARGETEAGARERLALTE